MFDLPIGHDFLCFMVLLINEDKEIIKVNPPSMVSIAEREAACPFKYI